jgi:tol-pal system protein YbgF
METIMTRTRLLLPVALVAISLFAVTPAFAVSKEIVQLQTQVQALQDQMTQMRQSFDERMGVMKNLIEQSTDNVNKVAAAVNDLQQKMQQQNADVSGRTDQVSGQIQALNDTLDEVKAQLGKLTKQLADMQSNQQNLNAQQNQPPAQAPPPDVLYNNALRDYNAGKYDLAGQEFSDYLKYYSNTDLAGNAQFYMADIEYRQGNFQQAVKDYDKVLQQYPGGNKTAAAQLKKGLALIELGQKDEGVRELNGVVQRYPRSIEASQAREKLRSLGVGTRTSRRTPPR